MANIAFPRRRERGAVAVVMAVGMTVLIACVGMALDGGLAYLARARLQNAVDGAALAAGRVGQRHGGRPDEWAASAQLAARHYFHSAFFNKAYEDGDEARLQHWQVTVHRQARPRLRIEVEARIVHPLFFMPVLGFPNLPIRAQAEVQHDKDDPATQGSRDAIDLVMVTDMSSSILSTVHSAKKDWFKVVEQSVGFFEKLSPRIDRAAMIAYGDGVLPLVNFTQQPGFSMAEIRQANRNMLDTVWYTGLKGVLGGSTATGPALALANHALHSIRQPAPRQVLLLFTDGVANRFCRGGLGRLPCPTIDLPNAHAETGLPIEQMQEALQTAHERGTQVLVVGYGKDLDNPKILVTGGEGSKLQTGEAWLREALDQQPKSKYCKADDEQSLQQCYLEFAEKVLEPNEDRPLRLVR